MQPPADTQTWLTVVGIPLGVLLGVASMALKQYMKGRSEEDKIGLAGGLVGRSIGAAFVDKTVADAIIHMGENVAKMLHILEKREDREASEELEERIAKRLRQELLDKKPPPRS